MQCEETRRWERKANRAKRIKSASTDQRPWIYGLFYALFVQETQKTPWLFPSSLLRFNLASSNIVFARVSPRNRFTINMLENWTTHRVCNYNYNFLDFFFFVTIPSNLILPSCIFPWKYQLFISRSISQKQITIRFHFSV